MTNDKLTARELNKEFATKNIKGYGYVAITKEGLAYSASYDIRDHEKEMLIKYLKLMLKDIRESIKSRKRKC